MKELVRRILQEFVIQPVASRSKTSSDVNAVRFLEAKGEIAWEESVWA